MNKKDNNNNYYDIMEKVAEQNYKNWGFPNVDYALLHALNDNTYNYRGYYNKYPNGKGNAIDHWTDEFKTVYHPTFSKESKYSGKKSQYNPKGIKGGSWLFGKFFIPSKDQLMEYFKKGGGIHIKEKNKGKFTDYCGGKVTSECIQKGKNSPNAAIRKRATFAANARKWKHQEGGTLDYTTWSNMTPKQQQTYRINRSKAYLQNPTIGNVYNAAKSILGGFDPENPNLTKMVAPDILPGKVPGGFSIQKVRSLKLPAITNKAEAAAAQDWMLTQGYRYNPKGNPIKLRPKTPVNSAPKPQRLNTDYTQSGTAFERFSEGKQFGIAKKGRVSTTDKYSRAMEKQDARITNAGNSNMKKAQMQQIISNFDNYPAGERKAFDKGLKNLYRRGVEESKINKWKREFYRRLADKYGYFKQGGQIPKYKLGDALGKIGEFANSDLGKGLLTIGSNIYGGIKNSIQSSDQLNAFDKETSEQIQALKNKQMYQNQNEAFKKATQTIQNLSQNSKDVYYGDIDVQMLANKYAQQMNNDDEINSYITDRLKLRKVLEGQLNSNPSLLEM